VFFFGRSKNCRRQNLPHFVSTPEKTRFFGRDLANAFKSPLSQTGGHAYKSATHSGPRSGSNFNPNGNLPGIE
jgi:hypothetical protein